MRQFTKTHNDIEWLFPIANSKKGAEAIFDEREEQAEYYAEQAGVDADKHDIAIDAFMKGASSTLQRYGEELYDRVIRMIYEGLFKVKRPDVCEANEDGTINEEAKKAWHKYFRFLEFKDLMKEFTFPVEARNKYIEKQRQIFYKMMEGSCFDMDAPVDVQDQPFKTEE